MRTIGLLPLHSLDGNGLTCVTGIVLKEKVNGHNVTFANIRDTVEESTKFDIKEARWFSTYSVHHRVAERFQIGRCVFICGDAAHLHSPVSGQGMNTGLGDATNLAWKLAAASQGKAAPEVLDTYGPERSAFAKHLVNTDARFRWITAESWVGWLIRRFVLPYLQPLL